ncbi:hypothetical protein RFI_13907 [Reticulomyxa filosa]|uniref:Uncharacterized protein n=1 Tax=Reticulomyxa filosa TaxID=46433 RepID=X6NBW0_RETFI|nr:hypothetical protein RFI_13907 [Reticulomyxa filosa]|eukprot:ETO23274.1 hypothetical protein RFI_13907 [Reticulomyxa filosa]
MSLKNGNATSVDALEKKCTLDNSWDLDISSLSAQVCPVQQIDAPKLAMGGTASIHTIINKSRFKCFVKQTSVSSLDRKLIRSATLTCDGQLKSLEFYLSFIDLHIFRNMLKNFRETFTPSKNEPLKVRIARLVPEEMDLKNLFDRLKGNQVPRGAMLRSADALAHRLSHRKGVLQKQ